MNILYITSEYPPETGFGGIATYTKYIAETMAKKGHQISVITLSTSVRTSKTDHNGVTVYRTPPLPYPLPHYRWAYPLRQCITRLFPHLLNRIAWALAVREMVQSLIDRDHFDLIEAPECGAEGLLIPLKSDFKYIVRIHTPWEVIRCLDNLKEAPGDMLLLPFLEMLNAGRANALSAPSNAIAALMRKRWKGRIVSVIPNPLPVDSYSKSTGTDWIYTGRIERRKGVHTLVKAYTEASRFKRLPVLHLFGHVYGTYPGYPDFGKYISFLITSAELSDRIILHGHVPHRDIQQYLRQASVAFFPSVWENFPYSCLEAMASGCLVVASNCGGFPEIITHNKSGLLVTPDCVTSLKNAMLYIHRYNNAMDVLRNNGRKQLRTTVESSVIGEKMEQFYRQCLSGS